MTRRTQFSGSASGRRRERRAHLQSEASNSSEVMHRPTPNRVVLQCARKQTGVNPGVTMKQARREVKDFRNQIIRATYLFEYEFKREKIIEGPHCLPEVAIFRAGHRKSNSVTAR